MPAGFLKIESDKYILKFMWKVKGLMINQNNLEKEKSWKMYNTRLQDVTIKLRQYVIDMRTGILVNGVGGRVQM